MKRFWKKVEVKGEEDCWEWSGVRDKDGYGQFRLEGKIRRANRVAFELVNGEIEPGLVICHRCDNPPCCNPAHLLKGTSAENRKDMQSKGRWIKSNNLGEINGNTKLTQKDVIEIRRLRTEGQSLKKIAAAYEVNQGTIHDIVNRRTWKHI